MTETDKQKVGRGGRVSIDKSVHELYRDLTAASNTDQEFAPFLLMKDVFMWAMALGVRDGKRKPLGKREQIFRWDQFSSENDIPFLRAVAIVETGEVETILNEEEVLTIAEEYANGGIGQLRQELVDKSGQPLWNMINFVREY